MVPDQSSHVASGKLVGTGRAGVDLDSLSLLILTSQPPSQFSLVMKLTLTKCLVLRKEWETLCDIGSWKSESNR